MDAFDDRIYSIVNGRIAYWLKVSMVRQYRLTRYVNWMKIIFLFIGIIRAIKK